MEVRFFHSNMKDNSAIYSVTNIAGIALQFIVSLIFLMLLLMILGNNLLCFRKLVCCNYYFKWTPILISLSYLSILSIYATFLVPYLIDYTLWTKVISVFTLAILILSFIYYIRSCIGDPGIIPKNYTEYSLSQFAFSNSATESSGNNTPRIYTYTKLYLFNRQRECHTCNIMRPPLASHCRYCDNCVIGFDQ